MPIQKVYLSSENVGGHALNGKNYFKYFCLLVFFLCLQVFTRGAFGAVVIATPVVTGSSAFASWELPQSTVDVSLNGGGVTGSVYINSVSHDNGPWLPSDITVNLSCSLIFDSDDWEQPFNYILSGQDGTAYVTFPEKAMSNITVSGSCHGLLFNNRNEAVVIAEARSVASVSINFSSGGNALAHSMRVSEVDIGALDFCTISTPNSVVTFTGTPEEYINGMTQNIYLNISCASASASASAKLWAASAGVANGDCLDVDNQSLINSGRLTFCLSYEDNRINLNNAQSAVIPLNDKNADIILHASMQATSIDSVTPGEYSTILVLTVTFE